MDSLGDEVRRELRRFGPAAEVGQVVAAWPAAVGEAIARNAWPLRVGRDGTLHVAVSSSAWACELTLLEEDIRSRLAAAVGDAAPGKLRFVPGPIPETPAPAAPESLPRRAAVSPAARAEGEQLAAGIEDPELRELIARAASASLARAASGRGF